MSLRTCRTLVGSLAHPHAPAPRAQDMQLMIHICMHVGVGHLDTMSG